MDKCGISFVNDISTTPAMLYHQLDLLTPPPSDECDKSIHNVFEKCKGDTPLSHRTGEASNLPRVFHRKCNISAKSAVNLSSISEEAAECRTIPMLNVTANFPGAISPNASPQSKNLNYYAGMINDCPGRSIVVPLKKTSDKRAVVDNEGTPKKKVKPLKCYAQTLLDADQKENSPIKIDVGGCLGHFHNSNSSFRTLVLKQPPIPLTLRSLKKVEDDRFDILASLANKNCDHVIRQIMDNLGPMDLVSVESVSHKWKEIAGYVVRGKLSSARQLALTSKENLPVRAPSAKSSNETTPRKVTMRNSNISPKRRIPESPHLSPKTKRFRAFVEEGKTLSPSKKLEKCPTCSYPARAVNDSCAVCSSCRFTFCIQCRCKPHPLSSCNFVLFSSTSPSPRKLSSRPCILSKASKKSLRRLL